MGLCFCEHVNHIIISKFEDGRFVIESTEVVNIVK